MMELAAATPDSLVDEPLGFSPTSRAGDLYYASSAQIRQRGQSFFNKIYGKVATRVMGQMNRCGTLDLSLTT